jgi:hypothetical protein
LHRWAVFGLVNRGTAARHLVIDVPHRGFAGSGIFWPQPPGGRIISLVTAGDTALQSVPSAGRDVYGLVLAPGQSAAIAFEIGDLGQPAMILWQREAYEARENSSAFFRGLARHRHAAGGRHDRLRHPLARRLPRRGRLRLFSVSSSSRGGAFPVSPAPANARLLPHRGRAVVEGLMAAFILCLKVTPAAPRHAG